MKINKEQVIPLIFGMIIALVILKLGFLIYKDIHDDIVRRAELPAKRLYLMTHPDIIGTNENGEVVKRYTILQEHGKHYIYELSGTKTTIIPKVKGQMDVIVEKNEN
jgi:hypothetical protein